MPILIGGKGSLLRLLFYCSPEVSSKIKGDNWPFSRGGPHYGEPGVGEVDSLPPPLVLHNAKWPDVSPLVHEQVATFVLL
jgi:hypothetical protein